MFSYLLFYLKNVYINTGAIYYTRFTRINNNLKIYENEVRPNKVPEYIIL